MAFSSFREKQLAKLASLTGETTPLGTPGVPGFQATSVTPAIRELLARVQAMEQTFFGMTQNVNLQGYKKDLVLPVEVTNGDPIPVHVVDPAKDFFLDVRRGVIPRFSSIHKYGFNPSITGERAIWDNGGASYLYNWQTADQPMEILSSSANDDGSPAGTGARTVVVIGQNYAGTEQEETVTMNGVTPVNLKYSYSVVYRAYVDTCGSNLTNAGLITIRVQGAGATLAEIKAGNGQSLMAVYRIPAGKTGYMVTMTAKCGDNATNAVGFARLWKRPYGGAWRVQEVTTVRTTGSTSIDWTFLSAPVMEELTEIQVSVNSAAAGIGFAASFEIILIDN